MYILAYSRIVVKSYLSENLHFGMALTSPVLWFWHHFKSGVGPESKSLEADQQEHIVYLLVGAGKINK